MPLLIKLQTKEIPCSMIKDSDLEKCIHSTYDCNEFTLKDNEEYWYYVRYHYDAEKNSLTGADKCFLDKFINHETNNCPIGIILNDLCDKELLSEGLYIIDTSNGYREQVNSWRKEGKSYKYFPNK
jgi:hypothetical protein